MKDIQEVISALKKNGAQSHTAVVKTASAKADETADGKQYFRVYLTLNKEIEAFVFDEKTEDFVKKSTRTIRVLNGSIGAILRESEEYALITKDIISKKDLLEMVLSYAEVSFLAEDVKKDTKYVDPFSQKEVVEEKEVEHDSTFCHLTNIKLGRVAKTVLDKYIERKLDKMFKD